MSRFRAALATACLVTAVPLVPAGAQQAPPAPLDLAAVERIAADSNPGLQAWRLEVLKARGDLRTAGLRPNPVLAVAVDPLALPSGSGGVDPSQGNYGATFQVPIERGGKRDRRLEVAGALLAGSESAVADSLRQVLRSARQGFVELQAAAARSALADSTLGIYARVAELNRQRRAQQQIAGAELARSELARDQAALDRDAARLAATQAALRLAQLLGRREPVAGVVPLSDRPRALPSLDSLLAVARTRRPDLAAARATAMAAAANVRLQDALAKPDITIGPDAGHQTGVAFLGVSASIPLATRNHNEGERDRARAGLEQASRGVTAVELAVEADVRTAWEAARTRRAALDRFTADDQGILARAAAIRASAEFAYRNGSSSLLELLDAVRTSAELTRAYVDAVALHGQALADLDAATAVDIAPPAPDPTP